jgi:ribonucleoside-diphosphate reductase alpha chain
MNIANQILSDITVYMKYARYVDGRRETWEEIVDRNKNMHIKKFPQLKNEIEDAYQFVYEKKVLPSMRSMQFAGKPIEISPNRIFNCSYLPIDDWHAFSEIMFLLLGGTGVGYSVQLHHIEKLPEIRKPNPNKKKRFLIGDSIEGWADSIKILMKSYFFGGPTIDFDFSDIRQKGTTLVTSGGKAPGPQPLKECITRYIRY